MEASYRKKEKCTSLKEDSEGTIMIARLFIIIYFCCLFTVKCQDPCSSTEYETIGGEDRRSADYEFVIGKDFAYSDDRLPDPPKWYRIMNEAGEDMPTSAPGTFRCGTWYPIWLNGSLPDTNVTTTQPVCLETFINRCRYTWNIEIKNCSGQFFVYKLTKSPIIDSAYCFGRTTLCPVGSSSETGFTPDCLEYYPNITIKAVVKSVLMNGTIPYSRGNLGYTEYNLEPVFLCHFDNPETVYYYDIYWYINEISVKDNTNEVYDSNNTILRPKHWEASFDMNMLVKCAVRVRAGQGTLPSPRMYSPNYVAGIVIENYAYEVEEGQSINITLRATVPVGCYAPSLLSVCKETLKVSYPANDSCTQSQSSSAIPIVEESCGTDIMAYNWSANRQNTLKVYGNIDNTYNLRSVRYASLSLSKAQSETDRSKAWDKLIIPDINILIRDGDTQLEGMVCYSHTDPNYRTFDGSSYSVQISGEYVLYKHKREPYWVHTLTSGCYWGSCNVGIAIRSHDSLLVVRTVDKVYNPIQVNNASDDFSATFTSRTHPMIDMRDCNDKNLRVSRNNKEFTVTLPSGTEIFFRIKFDQSSYHNLLVVNNINIKPSVMDIRQTEGLCGFMNFNLIDDYTDANGDVVTRTQFIDSWRISNTSNTSLFSESPLFTNDQFYKRPFCVCGEEAGSNDPLGNKVHCNLTEPMEQCYNTRTSSENYLYTTCSSRKKRNSDVSDEIMDITPLSYAENFKEGYIPPELQWRSGWTEDLARDTCVNAFNNISALETCKEFAHLDTDQFIEPCITDIKATGSTTLLEGTITTMISSCITEVSRNETLMTTISTNSSNGTSTSDSPVIKTITLLDEIKSKLCLDNCSSNGFCAETGVCKCNPGFIGEQCSIAENSPPEKISIPGNGLCGTRSRSCSRTFVNGVYESETIWCKLTYFSLIDNEKKILLPPVIIEGEYYGFSSVSCPMTTSNQRRKRSVTLPPVEGYHISLSYDGTNFGDEVSVIIYDESCYSCNATTETCDILESCPLFKTTAAAENSSPSDEMSPTLIMSTQVSKTTKTTENEEKVSTDQPSITSENIDMSPSRQSTKTKYFDTVPSTQYSISTYNGKIVKSTKLSSNEVVPVASTDQQSTTAELSLNTEQSTTTENVEPTPSTHQYTTTDTSGTKSTHELQTTEKVKITSSTAQSTTENAGMVRDTKISITTAKEDIIQTTEQTKSTVNIEVNSITDYVSSNGSTETPTDISTKKSFRKEYLIFTSIFGGLFGFLALFVLVVLFRVKSKRLKNRTLYNTTNGNVGTSNVSDIRERYNATFAEEYFSRLNEQCKIQPNIFVQNSLYQTADGK